MFTVYFGHETGQFGHFYRALYLCIKNELLSFVYFYFWIYIIIYEIMVHVCSNDIRTIIFFDPIQLPQFEAYNIYMVFSHQKSETAFFLFYFTNSTRIINWRCNVYFFFVYTCSSNYLEFVFKICPNNDPSAQWLNVAKRPLFSVKWKICSSDHTENS
jgi:hypothetical protein